MKWPEWTSASSCGEIVLALFGTEETELAVDNMIHSHFPAGCICAIVDIAVVIWVLDGEHACQASPLLPSCWNLVGFLGAAPFNPMDKEVDW